MNAYVTGKIIRELRGKLNLTQAELAEKINVSDKTVSKWETGKGYPDLSLLEPLAKVFGVSVTELLAGNAVKNGNVSANMLRSVFYVCPLCGNIFHGMGDAVVQCHGILLMPCQAEETDERHMIFVERVEDEYYVRIDHDMTKQHYISFIAALSSDKVQMIKLYPEGNVEARFKINGVKRILFYCNQDGMYFLDVMKGIDDKLTSYDDTKERRKLEHEANRLLYCQ